MDVSVNSSAAFMELDVLNQSVALRWIGTLHMWTNVPFFIYTGYFLYRMINHSLIHINLKLILLALPITIFLLSTSHNLMLFLLSNGYFKNNFVSKAISIFHFTFAIGFASLFFNIFFERRYATKHRDNYEHNRSPLIGIILISSSLLFGLFTGIFVVAYDLYIANPTDTMILLYPFMPESHPQFAAYSYPLGSVGVFLGALQLNILYRLNNRIISRSRSISLSHRYQLNENVVTIRMLFPLALIEGVGCAFSFVAVIYRIHRLEKYGPNDEIQMICIHFLYLLIDIFGYIYLSIVLFTHKPLRLLVLSDFYKWCPVACRPKRIANQAFLRDANVETNIYFNSLRSHWDIAPAKS